jgi:hypothetical protein
VGSYIVRSTAAARYSALEIAGHATPEVWGRRTYPAFRGLDQAIR